MVKRTKKAKITEQKLECYNCRTVISLTPQTVQTRTLNLEISIIATYIECPVCGERMLKQLDTEETYNILNPQRVKLMMKQRKNEKLSLKQKDKLSKLNRSIDNTRQKLKPLFWDKVYQLLNPQEDETGTADQELTLGEIQEPTPETVGKGD